MGYQWGAKMETPKESPRLTSDCGGGQTPDHSRPCYESFSRLRQRISGSVRLQEKSSNNPAYSPLILILLTECVYLEWFVWKSCWTWLKSRAKGELNLFGTCSSFHPSTVASTRCGSCRIHHDPWWSAASNRLLCVGLDASNKVRIWDVNFADQLSQRQAKPELFEHVWTVWFMIIMCGFERRLHRQPLVAKHPIPCHRCQGSSGESSNFADVDLGFLPPLLLAWLGCTCQLFNTTCKHVWRNTASNRRWSHGLYTNYINTHQREQKRLGTSWNIILWLKHFSETVTSVVRLAASESLPNSFNSSSLWTLMKADNTTICPQIQREIQMAKNNTARHECLPGTAVMYCYVFIKGFLPTNPDLL